MQQMNASILLKIAKLLKFLLHEQFNDYKYGYIYNDIQSVDLAILMLFIREWNQQIQKCKSTRNFRQKFVHKIGFSGLGNVFIRSSWYLHKNYFGIAHKKRDYVTSSN